MCLLGTSNALKVGDIVPIATGHEREELEAELQASTLQYLFLNQS